MNKIVFGNLGLLDIYLSDQILISEGNELSLMGKDDYDTVEKLSSLEYPIYFTYHELLNKISYDKDLSYTKKIYYLDKIYESLDILIQYIDDYDEENSRICFIIDNIYERYETVRYETVYTWGEKVIFLFDDLVDSFRSASKYLYFTPTIYPLMYLKPGNLLENEGECDSYSEGSEETGSESDKEESPESNDDSGNELSEDGSDNDSEGDKELIQIEFENVEYLVDESTGEIYNVSHQLVGEWNKGGDDIIWKSSKFKKTHDILNELD
tara:strand:- start:2094 stop:2897 length:804 start_codon:yes stop_codon:yes gene_type:complete